MVVEFQCVCSLITNVLNLFNCHFNQSRMKAICQGLLACPRPSVTESVTDEQAFGEVKSLTPPFSSYCCFSNVKK